MAMVQDTTDLIFRQAPSINPIATYLVKERFFLHKVFGISKELLSLLVGQSWS